MTCGNCCGTSGSGRERSRRVHARTGNVVHLNTVLDTVGQYTPTSGPVPVVLAVLEIGRVLGLLVEWQLVELLPKRKLPVDGCLRDAEIGHVKEALGADRVDEGRCQLGTAFVCVIL